MEKVYITGIGKYIPKKVLTNHDIEKMVDTSDEWITTRTGIKERHVVADDQCTSDIAVLAAKEAMADAGLKPTDIDLIIVATITGDMQFPATSCVVQRKLHAKNAVAFDISAACAGFPYALSIASEYIKTGRFKHVLVIGAEALSRFTDWTDRGTCILFGDGAGAAVVSNVPGKTQSEVLSDYLGTDGTHVGLLNTPGGGSVHPATHATVDQRLHYIKMEGNAVFKIAVKSMTEAVNGILQKNELIIDDIASLIPHQANLRIIKAVGKAVKIAEERVFVNVDKYGNMSSATTIVALYDAVRSGVVRPGDLVVLVAFGGGFVWGATLIRW
ncbi:MAG: ketoacyl-ACP synthase III [Candidatus Omnitrophica bacterium]|nr:ketoacyl-ACP synthase III [Candidatus Omnitrophota bacterium]